MRAVYRKHADDLTRFATGLVGPSDAADVVSEAVLSCLSSPSWASVIEKRSYLYRSVYNKASGIPSSFASPPIARRASGEGGPRRASRSSSRGSCSGVQPQPQTTGCHRAHLLGGPGPIFYCNAYGNQRGVREAPSRRVGDHASRRHSRAMTDTLDSQIRVLLSELMDAAPQAPPLSDIEWRDVGRAADTVHRSDPKVTSTRRRRHSPRLPLVAAFVVPLAIVAVAGLLLLGGNAAHSPTTASQPGGTWKLTDDSLSGRWKEYTSGGPPPGSLSCPSTSTCYAMSGQYKTPARGPSRSLSLFT